MYVSVPKNYSGNAFSDRQSAKPQTKPSPILPGMPPEKKPSTPARRPLGLDAEELLLIGLIALLMGREDCGDLVWMLALLLLA